MDHICTWLCADKKGEESIFPQSGQKSSSQSHQNIYWRCLLLFFATSRRFNKHEKHVLFTNVTHLPEVDGQQIRDTLVDLQVDIIYTDFKYKTPKGYFELFQNQFYEFSILEYIVENNKNPDDNYLVLDSDCIFLRSARELFNEAKERGFLSFEDDCTTELVIHGLSRKDMKSLYEDLLNERVDEIPGYHLGEFLLASVKNINVIFSGFLELWPELLRRHRAGLPKFNEEAQTLSFLYYKNNFKASTSKTLMRRIWTNPVFYRDVEPTDIGVAIWHLPAEKQFGLSDLYQIIINKSADYGSLLSNEAYLSLVQKVLGIPGLSLSMKLRYYMLSYYRALKKRAIKKMMTKAAM